MARRNCDGAGLLGAFRAAVANLEAYVDEINALNVFPVPDGDTGSNMLATVRAALAEAEGAGERAAAERVAAAASFGALMGARGNSGVIASQILRGFAEGLAGKARFNGLDLANAIELGTKAAYGAVAKPVEGTILTVIREASAAAVEVAERQNDLEAVLTVTLDAAEKSVARTPALLPILREAGVVDAGGQGLYRLIQGALFFLAGRAPARAPAAATATARPSVLVAHADEGFGYETMYLLQARPGELLDVDALRGYLESIGASVLVAGDARAVKVHVHNERPDLVIGHGLGLGSLSRISVENLDIQTREVRETRAAAFTGAGVEAGVAAGRGPGTGPAGEAGATAAARSAAAVRDGSAGGDGLNGRNGSGPGRSPGGPGGSTVPLAVVAVAAGEGFAAIFRDFGVSRVVAGGQASNPSTGELLEAVLEVDAREVLVLPNNPNVVLAARQVAGLAGRPVAVVATRNAPEGFAALLALDPTKDAEANAAEMTAAGRAIQTLAVTTAVRDAAFGGTKVRAGQIIVLDPDDGLVAVSDEIATAVLSGVAALQPGFELLTVYYGEGVDLASTETLARRIGEVAVGAEVEVVHGGQPHYPYLISAE